MAQEAREAASRQQALQRAAELEALLDAAFGDASHPPDLEFGCFAVVLGPRRSGFEGEALLRIDTGAQSVKMPGNGNTGLRGSRLLNGCAGPGMS